MAQKSGAKCPKCGGHSWYEQINEDLVQKCLCGLHNYVAIRQPDGSYIRRRTPRSEVTLPKKGSKLFESLEILAVYYPARMNTKEVSIATGHSMTDTASELTVLDHKALVEKVEERKGLPGGSIWVLSHVGAQLLKILKY